MKIGIDTFRRVVKTDGTDPEVPEHTAPPPLSIPPQEAPQRPPEVALPPPPGAGPGVPPGAAKGLENERRVLFELHRFGWLTARQVGQRVWPEGTQSLQMARRVLRRLASKRKALARELSNKTPAWVLTSRGAAQLRESGVADAQRGTDQLRSSDTTWLHRWIVNQYIIEYTPDDARSYSEFEILTYRSPLPPEQTPRGYMPMRSWFGKTPDALWTEQRGPQRLLTWIEVERTRKKRSDLTQLCELIVSGLFQPIIAHSDLELDEIHLVYVWDHQRPETAAKIFPLIKALVTGVRKRIATRLNVYESDVVDDFASDQLGKVLLSVIDIGPGPVFRGKTFEWWLDDLMHHHGLTVVKHRLGAAQRRRALQR